MLGLLLGAGLIALVSAGNKSKAIGQIQAGVKDVKMKFANSFLQISITLIVRNPTTERLRFKNFSGKVFLDSQLVGNVDISNPVDIAPKADTPVQLSASLPVTSILKTVATFLLQNKMPSKGAIDGVASVGPVQVKLYKELNFSQPATA